MLGCTPVFVWSFCSLAEVKIWAAMGHTEGENMWEKQRQQTSDISISLRPTDSFLIDHQNINLIDNAASLTWRAAESRGHWQLPQLGVGRQILYISLVHSQEDVFWLDVCVDNLAFSVQVI